RAFAEGLLQGAARTDDAGFDSRTGVGFVLATDLSEELIQIVNDTDFLFHRNYPQIQIAERLFPLPRRERTKVRVILELPLILTFSRKGRRKQSYRAGSPELLTDQLIYVVRRDAPTWLMAPTISPIQRFNASRAGVGVRPGFSLSGLALSSAMVLAPIA